MINNKLKLVVEGARKRGFVTLSYKYSEEEDRLTIHGERRDLVAYEKGKFYTVGEAKMNATRVDSRDAYKKR